MKRSRLLPCLAVISGVAVALLGLASPAAAEEATPQDGAALQGTVGEIRIVTKSIFDPDKPGEDKWVFRMADRLHRTTRPGVIERQLLLKPGDPYSWEAVEESERLLRSNRY